MNLAGGAGYVALGSSFAAGPGISPPAPDRPRAAGQSQNNYAHHLARALSLRLADVTSSGATTDDILDRPQHNQPPQIQALGPATRLVTVTIGGNDLNYVQSLFAAGGPEWARSLPLIGSRRRQVLAESADPGRRERATARYAAVLDAVARRAPQAEVVCVDYLTVLPPQYRDDLPMPEPLWAHCRSISADLAAATRAAAEGSGARLVTASVASAEHHAWSARPWTTGFVRSFPGRRTAAYHPNAAGMRAVAELIQQSLAAPS